MPVADGISIIMIIVFFDLHNGRIPVSDAIGLCLLADTCTSYSNGRWQALLLFDVSLTMRMIL